MVAPTRHDHVEHGPAGQGKQNQKLHHRKAAAGFLTAGLGVTPLVGVGVGQLRGGTVHDFDRAPLQGVAWLHPSFSGLGGGHQCLFQPVLGQTLASLDIGRVACLDGTFVMQTEERLYLAHHFATGGSGPEHLPDEAFKGQAQAEDALPAVDPVLLGGKERRGQEVAQVFLELSQGGLADGGGAPAQRGQPGTPTREIGSLHSKYIHLLY